MIVVLGDEIQVIHKPHWLAEARVHQSSPELLRLKMFQSFK
jgi:hypothetical protein